MGLLDQVTGALGGAGKGGAQAVLMQQLVSVLSQPGSLSKLTSSFQQNGMGNIVQSWLSTGENLPISGTQLQQVLGPDTLNTVASKAGVAAPEAANLLSGMLPQVIDKISPDGKAPDSNQLGGLLSSVGKLFG
jgi:uncharacterized protein YidB (DUF937 family)